MNENAAITRSGVVAQVLWFLKDSEGVVSTRDVRRFIQECCGEDKKDAVSVALNYLTEGGWIRRIYVGEYEKMDGFDEAYQDENIIKTPLVWKVADIIASFPDEGFIFTSSDFEYILLLEKKKMPPLRSSLYYLRDNGFLIPIARKGHYVKSPYFNKKCKEFMVWLFLDRLNDEEKERLEEVVKEKSSQKGPPTTTNHNIQHVQGTAKIEKEKKEEESVPPADTDLTLVQVGEGIVTLIQHLKASVKCLEGKMEQKEHELAKAKARIIDLEEQLKTKDRIIVDQKKSIRTGVRLSEIRGMV